jgi:hypothetical protein
MTTPERERMLEAVNAYCRERLNRGVYRITGETAYLEFKGCWVPGPEEEEGSLDLLRRPKGAAAAEPWQFERCIWEECLVDALAISPEDIPLHLLTAYYDPEDSDDDDLVVWVLSARLEGKL